MPTFGELVRRAGAMSARDVEWLQALVAQWQLLADLSFADLVLYVPVRSDSAYLAVAQVRPLTAQTLHPDDEVGLLVAAGERHLVDRAYREGRVMREGEPEWQAGVPVREEAIPVRRRGRVVAVVSRQTNLAAARTPSELELVYLRAAGELALMVAAGTLPFRAESDAELAPRVGDGLLHLDADGRVTFASPNAVSAHRRLGLTANLLGTRLADVHTTMALADQAPARRLAMVLQATHTPVDVELEASGAAVVARGVPLLDGPPGSARVTGALVLVRDVTDVRRRERQLLTKDATIREIHHRVKNNLQTVAALLRLQARRVDVPEARHALAESVRRVTSIALVHETLSRTLDETVEFDLIADQIIGMVVDVATPGETTVLRSRTGTAGVLPAELATPLALVLAELLQNAVEHAFADRQQGTLRVHAERGPAGLQLTVADDGCGLPAGFALEHSTRLGLQIVRTLVVHELGGQIALRGGRDGGTEAVVAVPVPVAAS